MTSRQGTPQKGVRSLLLLVSWELWLERNARTSKRRERSVTTLLSHIKAEIRLWSIAGAKHLSGLCDQVRF